MLQIFAAALGFLIIGGATPSFGQDPIKDALIDFNRKCGPLSGKLPKDFTPEELAYCEGLANSVNQALGFQDNQFVVLPSVVRSWSGKPLQNLGGIQPCNKTGHTPIFQKYIGAIDIGSGLRGRVCTPPIPHTEKIVGLTCEAHGGGMHDACGNDGEFSDGSYLATVTIEAEPGMQGNKYCWWVYNQASMSRQFSVSVR